MLKRLRVPSQASLRRIPCWTCHDRSPSAGQTGLLGYRKPARWVGGSRRSFSSITRLRQDVATAASNLVKEPVPAHLSEQQRVERTWRLPAVCPGCGAHSQTVEPQSPGYYDVLKSRDSMVKSTAKQAEDAIFQAALSNGSLGESDQPKQKAAQTQKPDIPICERCHELLYQSRGQSIIHPSMQSIQAIIEESPHTHNHIYHVLDAADFPMSLIPNLQHALDLPRLRTQNRRSKTMRFVRGRVAEVSFIITRSDLLAPQKEQVDSLVPYLRDVLRDALGRSGKNVRLGNVRCVSAKRGWWTPQVKEEIWGRGGAGWMVGKVNVGKSALFEVVFPKGRNKAQRIEKMEDALPSPTLPLPAAATADSPAELAEVEETQGDAAAKDAFQESELEFDRDMEMDQDNTRLDEDEGGSLLPPAQQETMYPTMPIVSSLPGTTASPIRIPFGNGKGELIDLPGIDRSSIDQHVQDEHKKQMIMKSRVVPEQYTIKPNQSLLLGGMIRITPTNQDNIVLAYPFVPPAFEPHVTSTAKAIAIQTGVHSDLSPEDLKGQPYTGTVSTIATPEAKTSVKSAGTFDLEWNVTKRRTGPLTDRAAGKQRADNLPFIVYSADILIESVGWVELVCQVRRRSESLVSRDAMDSLGVDGDGVPSVEVWSPGGKFVGFRRPMGAWVLGGPKRKPVGKMRGRPRMSVGFQRRSAGGRD